MPFQGFRGFGAAARPVSEFPPLPPEEEESLLRRIMGTGMGGLQWAGQSLDKLGASVRGVLGGRPDQLLNLIPFSDTLGITDPSERVYGRDLLEQGGVLESNTPGLDFGDVAGFGVDVLTDPLSYLNPLGALSKGGHVARTAGVLDQLPGLAKQKYLATGTGSLSKRGMRSEQTLGELLGYAKANAADDAARQQIDEAVTGAASKFGYDLPDLLDQRLGGGFGFSAGPFGKATALGGEARPVGKYGETLDKIGQFVTYGNPVSRTISAGFSKAVRNQTDPFVQKELRLLDRENQLIGTESNRFLKEARDEFDNAFKGTNLKPNDQRVVDAARAFVESPGGDYKANPLLKDLPDLPEGAKTVLSRLKERKDLLRERLEQTGYRTADERFESQYGMEHFFRRATDAPDPGSKEVMFARDEAIRDVPGGTVAIEKLLQDSRLTKNNIPTINRESRVFQRLQKSGMTNDEINAANAVAKRVRNENIPLKNLSPNDRTLYRRRAAAFKAENKAKTFQGEVTRHRIIANQVYGMNRSEFKNARILSDAVKRGQMEFTDEFGRVTREPFVDPRRLEDAPDLNLKIKAERDRQRSLLNRYEQSEKLRNWVGNRDLRAKDDRLFNLHPLQDDLIYTIATKGNTAMANSVHDMFATSAKSYDDLVKSGENLADYTLLDVAYKDLSFKDYSVALQNFLDRTGGRFGKTPAEYAKGSGMYVPKSVVDGAKSAFKALEPKELHPLLDKFDRWVTNLFKTFATASPAFHVRNKMTGTVQNAISGAYRLDEAIKYEGAAYKFSKGETIKGLSNFPGIKRLYPGLSDEEATRKLAELVDIYDLRGSRFDEIALRADDAGKITGNPYENLFREYPDITNPGNKPISLTSPLREAFRDLKETPGIKAKIGKVINPNRMAGIGKGVVPEGVPMKPGEVVESAVGSKVHREYGRLTEDMNRVSAALGYLDQGYSPAAAFQRAKMTHVDYKNLSSFERNVMRRAMPFYSFFRGIAENTAKELMEHPGGKLAQTIRASNSGREGGGYVPDYIGEGAAIPLGPDKYLSRLGLMHEGAFDPFVFKTLPGAEEGEAASLDVFRTPARTMQKFLSMTNPAIKTPLELAFDKNLFTGRSHKDLYPYPIPGGAIRGDFATMGNALINASPASRTLRTVRKLSDERKSLPENVLSGLAGIGITDVYKGAEQAKELDARRVTEELLGESPNIGELTKQYAFKGSTLTPTEKSLLRLSRTFDKRAREKAKEIAAH